MSGLQRGSTSDEGDVDEVTLDAAPSTIVRKPRALWAVLAAVAVGAGALAVTAGGGGDTPPPGLPVALGASFAGRSGAEAAADSMLAWVEYVPGEGLPVLGGEAPAYRLRSAVTTERVAGLADALGIEGAVEANETGWTVSDADGALEVYRGGAAQWWYGGVGGVGMAEAGVAGGAPGCDGGPDCTTMTTSAECTATDGPAECITGECPDGQVSCAIELPGSIPVCGPGADCVVDPPVTTIPCGGPATDCIALSPPDDCAVQADGTEPCLGDDPAEPVADLPSQDEARAIALDLLAATGVDLDGAIVTVEDFGAWLVSVEPRLDGVPSGLLANVTVGAGGAIESAAGYLVTPERLGDYPVLDTRATIDRANAQSGALDGGPVTTSTAVDPAMTVDPAVDPAVDPGAPAASVPTTSVAPCAPQPDGRDICETTVPDLPKCPQVVPPADEPLGAPETVDCLPSVPTDPPVDAGPVQIVLTDAEPSLVLVGAVDGSTDAYLVPAYRFTAEDGSRADLAAVADAALTTPPTTDTSAPTPVDPPVTPTVPTDPCAPLVEGDASGTTHTVQPNPDCLVREPQRLAEGEDPQIGVAYYVDLDTTCHEGSVRFGGQIWNVVEGVSTDGWSSPHEGGTLTLDAADHGTFVGDAVPATKLAELRPRSPEAEYACDPAPRA